MRIFALLSLFFILIPFVTQAEEFNAGIVQGLWYSEEKVFAGDNVRIYVAIRNNTGSDLSGTVEFFDGDRRIDRKTVQALDGRIIESWADWSPTYGSHTLRANLARIELHKVGSTTQAVEVTSSLAEDILFVDYDTDQDLIGNEDDTDDDGDAVSDVQEKEKGTDPLVKNVTQDDAEEEEQTAQDNNNRTQEVEDDAESKSEPEGDHTPEGLEQYLTDSPAENVLSSVTSYINEAKENLDTYREERKSDSTQVATTSKPTVNADGFGEIARASSTATSFNLSDFLGSIFKLIGNLMGVVYSLVLTALSFVLGHPMIVQLCLLILILFFIIKAAAKVGRRPKNFK